MDDTRLPDGRLLRYLGMSDITASAGVTAAIYAGPHGLKVLVSRDATPHRVKPLLHVSLSYPGHDPSWEDIKQVKAAFFGDIDAAMILPRQEGYVNVHPHCFHLWEIPGGWGIR